MVGTWKISDFTAIKRTLGKESLFLRGMQKKLGEGEVMTRNILNNTFFFFLWWECKIRRQEDMHEVKLQNLRDRWAN